MLVYLQFASGGFNEGNLRGTVSVRERKYVFIRTEMSFRTSSSTRTGALRHNTAFHSSQLSGVMAKTFYNEGQKRGNVRPWADLP